MNTQRHASHTHPFHFNLLRRALPVALGAALGLSIMGQADLQAAESAGEFSKAVIDIGMVASDAARSAAFLTNAVGFKEVAGFPVTSELGKKIGLTDGHPTKARVFVLDEAEPATRIKLLAFPGAPGQPADQTYIHSTLGFRYLTIFVKDMTRALERLKQAKVPLLGETPVDLGGGNVLVAFKDPDGNFIELIGPRR